MAKIEEIIRVLDSSPYGPLITSAKTTDEAVDEILSRRSFFMFTRLNYGQPNYSLLYEAFNLYRRQRSRA